MSKIIPNYNNGDQFPASDANQTFVATNNILMDVANKNGVSIQESNNDALVNALSSLAMCRQNAFDVSGTANAIILTTNNIYSNLTILKYTAFLRFGFFVATTNTGSVTIQIGSLAALPVVQISGVAITAGEFAVGAFIDCIYDSVNNRIIAINGVKNLATTAINTLPYSVTSAKTTNGYASFITKVDNATIAFDTNSGATPIRVCFPDSSIQSYSTLNNVAGINTNGIGYLILFKSDVILTDFTNLYNTTTPNTDKVYYTNLLPVESIIAPTSPATNQLWLDISITPAVPKRWSGSTWIVTQFIKLGEFPRTAGVIGTPVSYALNGFYDSGDITVTGVNVAYFQPHCIGSDKIILTLFAKRTALNADYHGCNQWSNAGNMFGIWYGSINSISSSVRSGSNGFEFALNNTVYIADRVRVLCNRAF